MSTDSHAAKFIRATERETLDAHRTLMLFPAYCKATPEAQAEQVIDHIEYARAAIATIPAKSPLAKRPA